MLCRRCGMESSTTDVCEWCRRPMLPAGATVSTQAAKDLKQGGQPIVQPAETSNNVANGMLLVQEDSDEETAQEEPADRESETAHDGETQLRPLGGADQQHVADAPGQASDAPSKTDQQPSTGSGDGPRQPTHELSEDATRTSIDISQYVGPDQSIFRPIVREDDSKSGDSADLLKQRARQRQAGSDGPGWSENQRLVRCLIVGLAAGVVFALAQFFITHNTVNTLYMSIPLGRQDNLFTAVMYGTASGVVLGFGLGALLVRFQKGSGLGLVLGVLVGLSLGNSFWGLLPGVIVGIINGRIATLGVRRVINV